MLRDEDAERGRVLRATATENVTIGRDVPRLRHRSGNHHRCVSRPALKMVPVRAQKSATAMEKETSWKRSPADLPTAYQHFALDSEGLRIGRTFAYIGAMRWLPFALAVLPIVATVGAACTEETEGEAIAEGELGGLNTEGFCDGLPKLKVTTPPGVCVGLVYRAPIKAGKFADLRRPRGIAQLPSKDGKEGDLIVADMGAWDPADVGGVWRLSRGADRQYTARQIFDRWDKPSGVQVAADGMVYVGTPANIMKFDPADTTGLKGKPKPKLALGAFKATDPGAFPSDGRHPLRAFTFDKKDPNILYVNIGSHSDVCEKSGLANPCPEAEAAKPRGAILKYRVDGAAPPKFEDGEVVARGLRNSMALEVHPQSNLLLQAENSRDQIDVLAPELDDWAFPHEEINAIEPGAHYGWPYCFDDNVQSPEYRGRVDCARFKKPTLLLPPHTSPLGIRYYFGNMFPASYRGQILVSYHSGHENGQRLAFVPADPETGLPTGAPPADLIRGWAATKENPRGAPVDILVANDGSIFVTEDLTHTVLRVFFDKNAGNGQPLAPLTITKPPPPPEQQARCDRLAPKTDPLAILEKEVLDKACAFSTCHGRGSPPGDLKLLKCDAEGNAARLLAAGDHGVPLARPRDEKSTIFKLVRGEDGLPQMPAGGLTDRQMEVLTAWIRAGAPSKLR
jgi:glucose/arabinose dehydrogenase